MQKILCYLVPNRIRVIADMAGFITEYRQVYQRKIKLYKGINNVITFDVRNADQKKVDLRGQDPIANFFDTEHKLIWTKVGTVNPAKPALFTVTIEKNELDAIENQSLKVTTFLRNSDSTGIYEQIVYNDTQFGVGVPVDIEYGVEASFRRPEILTNFLLNFGDQKYYSDIVPFGPVINDDVNGDSTNTTSITYYPGAFRGIVEVQATTNQSTAYGNVWTTVATNTVVNSSSFTIDIAGNYTFIQFSFPAESGMFDKIVVRN